MNKYLILLSLPLLSGLACAPQRTTFNGAKQSTSQNSSNKTSQQVAKPSDLSVLINADQQASLHQLIEALDLSSGKKLEPGMYRVFREEQDQVGEPVATFRQEITRVEQGLALSETIKIGNSSSNDKRSSKIKDIDPIERGVRFLEAGNYEELYRVLALYLTLKLGKSIPEHPHVTIEIRQVGFLKADAVYGIILALKIKELPQTFVIETHFAPTVPRPFNIVYQAYGIGVEKPGGPKIKPSRIHRQVLECNPAPEAEQLPTEQP